MLLLFYDCKNYFKSNNLTATLTLRLYKKHYECLKKQFLKYDVCFFCCMFVFICKKIAYRWRITPKMNMNKKILFFFFICSSYLLNAQYTNVINSNRPGFSESPYSVGTGIYQLETGVFYNSSKIVRTFSIPNSFGYNMVFRNQFFWWKTRVQHKFYTSKRQSRFLKCIYFTLLYNQD